MPSAWTVVDSLDAGEHAEVARLLAAIEDATGDESLTEAQRERLDAGEPVHHALRRGPNGIDGYAVLADGDVIEAEPASGTFDLALAELLESLQRPVTVLQTHSTPDFEAAMASRGWHETRAIVRMRRPLPADPPPPTELTVRAFVPDVDDARWLAQNNASFATHPSQGHMTEERLVRQLAAPWFDPNGFLLFFDGEVLVASCWTKVKRPSGGAIGEIYVISVAPEAQGRGLGRTAVLYGLDWLARQGIDTAELFVEASNASARTLYSVLGFTDVARIVQLRYG